MAYAWKRHKGKPQDHDQRYSNILVIMSCLLTSLKQYDSVGNDQLWLLMLEMGFLSHLSYCVKLTTIINLPFEK